MIPSIAVATFGESGPGVTWGPKAYRRDETCRCALCLALLAAVANAEANQRRKREGRTMAVMTGDKRGRAA